MKGEPSKYSWWRDWPALGVVFGGGVVIFNSLFGRFPVYFFIPTRPVSAIVIGGIVETIFWAAIFFALGVVAEGVRRAFRGGGSWHTGAQAASLVVLGGFLARTLVDVTVRRGLFRFHAPPAPREGWLNWGLPAAALGVFLLVMLSRRGCPAESRRRTTAFSGLLALVFSAVWALVFNRAMATTQLEVPLKSILVLLRPHLLGLAVTGLGAAGLGWIMLRRGWTVSRLAGKVGAAAAAALLLLTVYYGVFPRSDRPHIIVSCWDTIRSSRMSLYGYERETTPFLDQLAPRSLIFEEAYTPSNYTLPSHATFFLGLGYRAHGYHLGDGADVLRYRGEFTLPDQMRELGYYPVLMTENPWVQSLDKGFAEVLFLEKTAVHAELRVGGGAEAGAAVSSRRYPDRFPGRMVLDWVLYGLDPFYAFTLDRIQLRAVAELLIRSRRVGPLFLFQNWMNVHDRYHPYGEWKAGMTVAQYDFPGEFDLSIRYTDQRFRDLHRLLGSFGQLDRTVFIVTSDHGEFLGEFNLVGHHKGLFEPVIRVPLAVIHPELGGQRVPGPVSLERLYHLVSALAGGRAGINAEDLAGIFLSPDPVIAEHGFLADPGAGPGESGQEEFQWSYTVIDSDWQLVYDPELRRHGSSWPGEQELFLFDIRSDPERERDVSGRHPEVVERLRGEYRGYVDRIPKSREIRRQPGLREDLERQLRAVGYLQ